ncbi:diacylglycerol kinase family protein [Pradoshia sp.]
MVSRDKPARLMRFFRGFVYAWSGIRYGLANEGNFRFHACVAVIVCFFGMYFGITKTEWLFVLTAIAGMFALELVNTAVEKTVDLITNDDHPLAEAAKDTAAGAVLVYAIYSVIVGLIIFLPRLMELFR